MVPSGFQPVQGPPVNPATYRTRSTLHTACRQPRGHIMPPP